LQRLRQSKDSAVTRQLANMPGASAASQPVQPKQGSELSGNIAQGLVNGRFPVGEGEANPEQQAKPTSGAEAAALTKSGGSGSTATHGEPAGRIYFRSVAQVGVQVAHGLAHAHHLGI